MGDIPELVRNRDKHGIDYMKSVFKMSIEDLVRRDNE